MPIRKMRIAKADQQEIREMYKYLQSKEQKGIKVPAGYVRILFGIEMLIDKFCDPQEDHLAQSPYLFEQHVAPEQ